MYYTRIFLFVKFSGHGESWEWLSIGYWREVRGEAPGWRAGDAGMVPLSTRAAAKGRKSTTQLAALRQVSPIF